MSGPGEIIISAEQIRARVAELASEISRDYQGQDLLLVGILKGAFIFLADLVRQLTIPVRLDFLGVATYGSGTVSSEEVKVFKDLNQPVEGSNILIVDDIVDSGITTDYLLRLLQVRNPRSVRVCALLSRKDRRKTDIAVDYVGFEVSDRFVVGYGMDLHEEYRHLPDIHGVDGE